MLALTRRVGDGIICRTAAGEEVAIKVLHVSRSGKVRLGIAAPGDCDIYREELEVRWTLPANGEESQVDPQEELANAG